MRLERLFRCCQYTRWVSCALCSVQMAFAPIGSAQTVGAPTAVSQEEVSVRAEDLKPVMVKHSNVPHYPEAAREQGEEGWVNLGFMVSAAGTPYEIYVKDSSGNAVLERTALKAMESWTFQPALLNGQPIDTSSSMKMNFELNGGLHGARPEFVSAYQRLSKAIGDHDRAAADAQLKRMHITTIYEDAYYGFTQYRYAAQWGTTHEQIAGLRRAIADEVEPDLLPAPLFKAALNALLALEINSQDYANAMSTWQRLTKLETDPVKVAEWAQVIAKLQALRSDERAYKVSGEILESSWTYRLFKKRFEVAVSSGHLSEVKLWCDKKFVTFPFNPLLQYRVEDRFGNCYMMLIGEPGTKFELMQL